jgi:hypothetical protein
MISIRCSSLPRLAACAASSIEPLVKIGTPRDYADLGSAFHEVMAARIKNWECGGPEAIDPYLCADKWQVERDELAKLVARGTVLWKDELRNSFPNPIVEEGMNFVDDLAGVELTGHPDLVSVVGTEARIPDWKSGFGDYDFEHQLKGYALLVMNLYPEVETVRVSIIKVRSGTAETLEVLDHDQLADWWAWLCKHLKTTQEYVTGPHCKFCPRVFECEARKTQIASYSWLSSTGRIDEESAGDVLDKARQLKTDCERLIETLRTETAARGGKYGALYIEEQTRRPIDYKKAKVVLQDELGQDTVDGLLSISKKQVEQAIAAKTPHGKKGLAFKALVSRLEQSNALTEETVEVLKIGAKK